MVRKLKLNKLKFDPDRDEVMLVGKADVLERWHLLVLDGMELAFAEQVNNLRVLLGIALLFEKQGS